MASKGSAPSGPATGAAAGQPQGTQELTAFVQNLLQQMQTRFQEMSDAIITRIDEMGGRIDDLEKSIADLMQQAGVEEGETAADSKAKP
jgi:heat shock factor-binding protein 1